MKHITIAYGRISTEKQDKEHLAQKAKILWKFKPQGHEFGLDIGTGDSDPFDRPMFPDQCERTKGLGVPLAVEHPDRILKSYSNGLIAGFLFQLDTENIQIQYALDNSKFNRLITTVLSGKLSRSRKIRQLIVLVERQIRWRHQNILSHQPVPEKKSTITYETLQSTKHHHVLEECAEKILTLIDRLASSSLVNGFLNAYLGMAYNLKHKHYMQSGKRFSVPRGQHSYLKNPDHIDLFRTIHQLDTTPTFTLAGNPKRPSCQSIADHLNAEGRFTNIHGDPFHRHPIDRIRNSEAYRIIVDGSSSLPPIRG